MMLVESSKEDDGVEGLDRHRVQAQVGDLVLAQEELRKLKLPKITHSALLHQVWHQGLIGVFCFWGGTSVYRRGIVYLFQRIH